MSTALFDAWLPGWRPDETLYSWCARYHRVAGAMRASQTSLRLFGHPRAGLAHDLGGCLTYFLDRTDGTLGSASDLLMKHTVLGYYMAFRSIAERQHWTSRLAAGTQGAIKSELGWLATRMGAAHPLKGCGACEADDIAQGNSPYWRLSHQVPGVWVCTRHRCALWATALRSNGLMRTAWLLPGDVPVHHRTCLAGPSDSTASLPAWLTIATVTQEMMAASAVGPIALPSLAKSLMGALQSRNLATASGRLQPGRLATEYLSFVSPLASAPEGDAICGRPSAVETMWRRLLQARVLHPLRYVLACAWLYGRWPSDEVVELSLSCVARDKAAAPSARVPQCLSGPPMREELLRLVSEGMSPTAAAHTVGVDTSTGLLWAESGGQTVKRRPKALDPSMRARLIKQLASGTPKAELADQSGLSVVTITRILLSTPGLKQARDQSVFNVRQRKARQKFESLSRRHPSWGCLDIRRHAGAEYAWLYRNDREWLQAIIAKLPEHEPSTQSRVDWKARDHQYASAVTSAAEHYLFHATPGDPYMRMTDFARLVPGLYTKLRHLDRMPTTAQALRTAVAKNIERRAGNFRAP